MLKKTTKLKLYHMSWHDNVKAWVHKKYLNHFYINFNIEIYIRSKIRKKTLETISFEQCKIIDEGLEKKYYQICYNEFYKACPTRSVNWNIKKKKL